VYEVGNESIIRYYRDRKTYN